MGTNYIIVSTIIPFTLNDGLQWQTLSTVCFLALKVNQSDAVRPLGPVADSYTNIDHSIDRPCCNRTLRALDASQKKLSLFALIHFVWACLFLGINVCRLDVEMQQTTFLKKKKKSFIPKSFFNVLH